MDSSVLARRLSVLIPVALIIIQVAVFLILPDTIPLHVTDGEVTRWTDRFSIASILMFFAMPVVTLIVASMVDRASVAIHLAIFSAIQINNPLLVMVILILFIDTPLIWMVHFRFWKGNLNYDISLSTIATLASVTYMLVFGIMIGAMILIMLDEACRNLTLNVSFCVFTLLCMVIIGLILRATCLSNDKIGKRLEKAGLEITTE